MPNPSRQQALQALRRLGIEGPAVLLLDIVPLVEMAFADGAFQPEERAMVLGFLDEHVERINALAGSAVVSRADGLALLERLTEPPLSPAQLRELRELMRAVRLSATGSAAQARRILDGAMAVGAAAQSPTAPDQAWDSRELDCMWQLQESLLQVPVKPVGAAPLPPPAAPARAGDGALRGVPFRELLTAHRALGTHLRTLTRGDPQAWVRLDQLPWADAPGGLSPEHDCDRVLAVFFQAAGARTDKPTRAHQVTALLNLTLDRLVEVNRALSYDDLIDDVELETADAGKPVALAAALASMVARVDYPGVDLRLPPGLPALAQVRAAERWALSLVELWEAHGEGPLQLSSLVAAWEHTHPTHSPTFSAWSSALQLLGKLQQVLGPDWVREGPQQLKAAATWWAGQDTWDPFPDRNGNGEADERGTHQPIYDAFAQLARALER